MRELSCPPSKSRLSCISTIPGLCVHIIYSLLYARACVLVGFVAVEREGRDDDGQTNGKGERLLNTDPPTVQPALCDHGMIAYTLGYTSKAKRETEYGKERESMAQVRAGARAVRLYLSLKKVDVLILFTRPPAGSPGVRPRSAYPPARPAGSGRGRAGR